MLDDRLEANSGKLFAQFVVDQTSIRKIKITYIFQKKKFFLIKNRLEGFPF